MDMTSGFDPQAGPEQSESLPLPVLGIYVVPIISIVGVVFKDVALRK